MKRKRNNFRGKFYCSNCFCDTCKSEKQRRFGLWPEPLQAWFSKLKKYGVTVDEKSLPREYKKNKDKFQYCPYGSNMPVIGKNIAITGHKLKRGSKIMTWVCQNHEFSGDRNDQCGYYREV